MRRAFFTLAAAAVLTFATALPIASFGLTQVNLTCNDGTNITAEVDADTLAGLIESVQALTLYPAGLECTLTQSLVVHALGGIASAWPGGGWIVGGGRFQVPCADGITFHWVNFGVSAHTETHAAGATRGGTLNFTIPANQPCIEQGHVTSKPTCLKINAEQPKPPDGAWFAYLRSEVHQASGSLAGFPSPFGSGWKDTGNPGKQLSPDRLNIAPTSSCPQDGFPFPDAPESRPIVNGNITIHAFQS